MRMRLAGVVLAFVYGVSASVSLAQADRTPGPTPEVIVSELRNREIIHHRQYIAAREREHIDCPPGTLVCSRRAAVNPYIALRGAAPFQAQITPPEIFSTEADGVIAPDDWQNRHYCGATLVAPGWALTAAHCVDSEMVRDGFRIRVGMSNLATADGAVFPMTEVICFDSDLCNRRTRPSVLYRNDIALVRFAAGPDDFVRAPDPEYFRDRGVEQIALSENATRLTTWSEDGTLREWDAASGEELARTARIEDMPLPPMAAPANELLLRNPRNGGSVEFANGNKRIRINRQPTEDGVAVPDMLQLSDFSNTSLIHVTEIFVPPLVEIQMAQDESYITGLDDDWAALDEERTPSLITWDTAGLKQLWSYTNQTVREITDYAGHDIGLSILELSANGTLISDTDEAMLRDPATGEVRWSVRHPRSPSWQSRHGGGPDAGARNLVYAGSITPDGKTLITITRRYGDSDVWLWDVASGTLRQRFAQPDPLLSEYAEGARLIEGGAQLLTWTEFGTIRVWDVASGALISTIEQQMPLRRAILFAGDTRLAVMDRAGMTVWNLPEARQIARGDHLLYVEGIDLSPDQTQILSWGQDATARLWQVEGGAENLRIYHTGEVNGAAFMPDPSRIVSWSDDGTARITNTANRSTVMEFDPAINPPGSPLALPVSERPPQRPAVQYLAVASRNTELPDGAKVAIYGWGKTRSVEGDEPYASLQVVNLAVLGNRACAALPGMEGNFRVHSRVFCASDELQKTCRGDSGGPVIFDDMIVGVVSWGKVDCSGNGEPGVYTRVSSYSNWIRRQIGENIAQPTDSLIAPVAGRVP